MSKTRKKEYEICLTITKTYRMRATVRATDEEKAERAEAALVSRHRSLLPPGRYILDDVRFDVEARAPSGDPEPDSDQEFCFTCGEPILDGEGCGGPNGSVHERCADPDDDGMDRDDDE